LQQYLPVTDFPCPSFSVTLQQSDDAGRQIKVRCFSILKLMTSSKAVGRSTGISATAVPRKS
jgi:hypothetical protein